MAANRHFETIECIVVHYGYHHIQCCLTSIFNPMIRLSYFRIFGNREVIRNCSIIIACLLTSIEFYIQICLIFTG